MLELPVVQSDGNRLFGFDRATQEGPLTASLVVLWRGEECLQVFNRFREVWELPGGMIDPGETSREAAFRELAEESGQRPDELDFVAFAHCWYAPAERVESLAIYRGVIDRQLPFEPNDEISEITWWNPADALDGLAPIDGALVRLCG